AVRIDAVAAESGELVDRGLRDAPAERPHRFGGGGIAGGLDGFPEGRRAFALRQRRLHQPDRRDKGADGNAHGPSPNSAETRSPIARNRRPPPATEEVFRNGPAPATALRAPAC